MKNYKSFLESNSDMNFTFSDKNILEDKIDKSTKYVCSLYYGRIFKILGELSGGIEDSDETILCDVNGRMDDFISLKAKNCFKVTKIPNNFDYKKYDENNPMN